MPKPTAGQPLPIQPVDDPIICSPYEEPSRYWEYKRQTGEAVLQSGRRAAAYWYKTDVRRRGQLQLELEEERRDLVLVNRLRADVKRWRQTGWEGAENVTKDLLRHWWRQDRFRRLFFCQLEAVETVIYLSELRGLRRDGTRRSPRWAPTFTDQDFAALVDTPPGNGYRPLTRYCCKMATGSGKTIVMAMLIVWAFCNRGRAPSDERFPSAALVVCPNLTIKERLQVLRPGDQGGDYYRQFDLVPQQYADLLPQGKVLVTNWHLFAPESEHTEGGKSYGVVRKGPEDDDAFARRVLGELYDRAPILVFNDEGHHAYRPAPLPPQRAAEARAAKDANEEATVWITGLDRINAACGIRACIDLSATPFYIKGSGYPEGEPFPWLVSDFGLVDAIESGITKIPRLPVSDTTGRPEPKYFRLWQNITRDLAPAEKMSGSGKPKPDVVWVRAQDALLNLAGQYKAKFDEYEAYGDLTTKAPPVMIIVADNTDIAAVFHQNISGEVEVEEAAAETEPDDGNAEETVSEGDEPEPPSRRTKRPKRRIDYTEGHVFPELFQNAPGRLRTLRIDTKLLDKVESEDPETSKEKAAQELRQVVNTVGKLGQPGEQIRCVASVQMLTEGWDANNVTHILGLRAFGSQLLCEQVVGRGLRRMSYDVDPATGLLPPEYVDVYGIPFSVIPYKGRPVTGAVADPEIRHVHALPERAHFEIRFPNVEGYAFALRRNLIKADVEAMHSLIIEPSQQPTATFVKPASGYHEGDINLLGPGPFVEQNRQEYYRTTHPQAIEFEVARQVVGALVGEGVHAPVSGSPALRLQSRHQLFPQVLRIVHQYINRKVVWNGAHPCELGLEVYIKRMVERLIDAIRPDEQHGESPLMPLLNRYKPIGTTAEVDFMTRRLTRGTQRSHINQVVLDTETWESSAAFYLEQCRELVPFYARNDKLGLVIPYDYMGVPHGYEPDYLARLADGRTVVLEVKGWAADQTQAKHQAAERWIAAVNNWGKLGTWVFHVCRNPHMLTQELQRLADPQA